MLNKFSAFLAKYRGLPTLVAVGLVALNFVVQFMPLGWLAESHLLLHVGIIVGLLGVLLTDALG